MYVAIKWLSQILLAPKGLNKGKEGTQAKRCATAKGNDFLKCSQNPEFRTKPILPQPILHFNYCSTFYRKKGKTLRNSVTVKNVLFPAIFCFILKQRKVSKDL